MTFFTVLIITYAFDGQELQSRLLYTSEAACDRAIRQIETIIDPRLDVIQLRCARSNLLSASPRPKPRPDTGER